VHERAKKLADFASDRRKAFLLCESDGALKFQQHAGALRAAPGFDGETRRSFFADIAGVASAAIQSEPVYRRIRRFAAWHLLEFSQEGLRVRRVAQLPIENFGPL